MAENIIKVRQKQRCDTEANWTSKNPVLLAGEIAISSDKTGLMKVGDGKSLWTAIPYSKASLSKTDVTTALGYTPPTTNTTYSIGTSSTAGIVKLYTGTGSNTDGSMTQAAIKSALDGKSGTGHTHNYAGSGSAGGSANSAVKLDTATAGSTTQPVYFSGGKPAVCTYTLGKSVPSNAVFTDTWRGIQNNLTSDSTTESLSAAQGKVLKKLVDGKAATGHTHSYLPLSGGTLTGDLTINSGKLLNLSNSSRLVITKDSNNTPATAYSDFTEAFYTAYTEKNFALIMATPAVFPDGTINGVFGIHQRHGGLYVGYLKYKGAEADRKWYKLIDSAGDSSFMPKYNIKTLTALGSTGWSNNATDDKILPTMSFMAFWDGSYSSGHASNLAYCNKGAFGNVVTRNLAGNNNYKASDFSDLGAQTTVPSIETLAYWNGAYGHNDSKTWYYSNLAWCNKGAFANGAVTSIKYGTAAPSGTAAAGDIYIQIS